MDSSCAEPAGLRAREQSPVCFDSTSDVFLLINSSELRYMKAQIYLTFFRLLGRART